MDTIITFQSVHFALKCESKLLESDENITLITTPRSVSSQCGFSLEISDCDGDVCRTKLEKESITYDALYEKSVIDGVKQYVKKY